MRALIFIAGLILAMALADAAISAMPSWALTLAGISAFIGLPLIVWRIFARIAQAVTDER